MLRILRGCCMFSVTFSHRWEFFIQPILRVEAWTRPIFKFLAKARWLIFYRRREILFRVKDRETLWFIILRSFPKALLCYDRVMLHFTFLSSTFECQTRTKSFVSRHQLHSGHRFANFTSLKVYLTRDYRPLHLIMLSFFHVIECSYSQYFKSCVTGWIDLGECSWTQVLNKLAEVIVTTASSRSSGVGVRHVFFFS